MNAAFARLYGQLALRNRGSGSTSAGTTKAISGKTHCRLSDTVPEGSPQGGIHPETKAMSSEVLCKSYGRVSEEQQTAMSGLEFVQGLVDGSLPLNTMARTLGYDITEVESGRVVITVLPNDTHLNPAGGVHGGLSATMLDSCMGLAVLSKLDKGIGQTTLEFKISLVRPITPESGLIRAEGIVLTCGRRVGTAEGRVTDLNGRLLAHGTTTCLIFSR
jgi:uncharacterized protein (TIGR00369 family)